MLGTSGISSGAVGIPSHYIRQPGLHNRIPISVGPIADEMKRDVNDRDFDVSLHQVFQNKAAYDQYAKAERHLKLIAENQDNWKKVRVFDSYLEP